MALINTLDPVAVQERLAGWLPGRLPDAENVEVSDVVVPQAAGMSMTTILFKAKWSHGGASEQLDLVARVAPPVPAVFNDTDLNREFKLLQALEDTPINVPKPRWYEEDPEVLGAPFIVVDRAYGEVPSDDPPYTAAGWVMELAPARRGALYDELIEVVGQVQAVDWRAERLDEILGQPTPDELGIGHQLARAEAYYDWARDGQITSPTIDAALPWLHENAPGAEDLVLNWGDPRIGNIIYDRDDLSVQAVLNWELATIASPEQELGWLLLFPRVYSEGIGVPVPKGLQSREQLIASWQERTGRIANHVDYYEAFAATRLSMMMVRAGLMMIAGGKLPPGNPMPVNNPAANILANLLDLPAPSGESVHFAGNR
jgi:aminoglycoside phosphotransferase (APT) family kinase protein